MDDSKTSPWTLLIDEATQQPYWYNSTTFESAWAEEGEMEVASGELASALPQETTSSRFRASHQPTLPAPIITSGKGLVAASSIRAASDAITSNGTTHSRPSEQRTEADQTQLLRYGIDEKEATPPTCRAAAIEALAAIKGALEVQQLRIAATAAAIRAEVASGAHQRAISPLSGAGSPTGAGGWHLEVTGGSDSGSGGNGGGGGGGEGPGPGNSAVSDAAAATRAEAAEMTATLRTEADALRREVTIRDEQAVQAARELDALRVAASVYRRDAEARNARATEAIAALEARAAQRERERKAEAEAVCHTSERAALARTAEAVADATRRERDAGEAVASRLRGEVVELTVARRTLEKQVRSLQLELVAAQAKTDRLRRQLRGGGDPSGGGGGSGGGSAGLFTNGRVSPVDERVGGSVSSSVTYVPLVTPRGAGAVAGMVGTVATVLGAGGIDHSADSGGGGIAATVYDSDSSQLPLPPSPFLEEAAMRAAEWLRAAPERAPPAAAAPPSPAAATAVAPSPRARGIDAQRVAPDSIAFADHLRPWAVNTSTPLSSIVVDMDDNDRGADGSTLLGALENSTTFEEDEIEGAHASEERRGAAAASAAAQQQEQQQQQQQQQFALPQLSPAASPSASMASDSHGSLGFGAAVAASPAATTADGALVNVAPMKTNADAVAVDAAVATSTVRTATPPGAAAAAAAPPLPTRAFGTTVCSGELDAQGSVLKQWRTKHFVLTEDGTMHGAVRAGDSARIYATAAMQPRVLVCDERAPSAAALPRGMTAFRVLKSLECVPVRCSATVTHTACDSSCRRSLPHQLPRARTRAHALTYALSHTDTHAHTLRRAHCNAVLAGKRRR